MMPPENIILLVEDNLDDEALAIRALQKTNIKTRVVVARDGVEALDALFKEGGSFSPGHSLPRLILLDLKLPKIDGMEVLTNIRANPRTRLLPVVILTSSGEEDDIARSYTLGANSYIRKPISFEHFTDAVREIGIYWLQLNENPPIQK